MGNCFGKKVILPKQTCDNENQKQIGGATIEPTVTSTSLPPLQKTTPELEAVNDDEDECEKKKTVNVNNINGSTCFGGGGLGEGVKIRLVVTKEELKQILNLKKEMNYSSVEQLLEILRLSSRRRRYKSGMVNENWKPSLDSIPEH
ncbi:hypothetical protein JCGZ_22865 [Jatropha curcas]|uniref:Uncharacterized protein n=1 Tax=Jatropha curcas TaxID=180498 RepID=A0A067K0Q9_JATCU|nr:hypothetical protein JCGZ_22865 [Jatropha curcas]